MATSHDQVGPASIPTEIFSMILEKMRDEILQSTTPVVWKLRLEKVCPYSLRDNDPSVVSVQSDPNEDAQSGGLRAKARLRHLSPLRGINKKGQRLVMECFEVLPCSDSRHPPMFVRTDCDIFIPGKHQFYAEHVWKMGRFFYRPQPQFFSKIKHIQYDPLDFPYCSYWKTLRRAESLLQCLESVILKDTTIHLALEHELLPSNGDMIPLTNHGNGLQLLFLVRLRNMASSLPRFHDRWKPFKRRGVRLLVRESDVLQPSVEIVSTEQGLHLRRT